MPPLFDPRRMYRTPGFAPDGLYDDEQEPLPPLPDRIVPQGEQQSNMGLSGMIAAAPSQLGQVQSPEPPSMAPQPRQRIQLPSAPLPPKVGKMRQVLGHVAGAFVPQIGEEIIAPGYNRQVREYAANRQRLIDEAKINETAAQEDAHVANARAAMSRAEAANAQRDRTRGQMATDGNFTLSGDQARFDNSGRRIASNPLPPKPQPPGVKIGRDGRPYFEEGQKYVELPAGAVPASINATPRPDKGIAEISEIVSKQMPNATPEERDAKIVEMWTASKKLEDDKKKADIERARRAPAGRGGGGLTPTQQNTEDRRSVDARAKEFVAESGNLDKAIADLSGWANRDEMAEKVLSHLKVMKGSKIAGARTTSSARERLASRKSGANSTPAAANSGSKSNAPKVGEVKSGYRFKGGDPGNQSNWEKVN